jgi:signal transduction histidine kinase
MRSLIDGLSELATSDSQTTLHSECDLGLIAQQTLDMMSEEINEKHAEVDIKSLPLVKGNLVQYKQLFKNLFENAIKFSNKSEVIKVCVTSAMLKEKDKKLFDLPAEKNFHRIEVSDNGIGFNQSHAEKIFEPFVRLHSKSEYEGSGLGLSICRKIVANHHGIIYAEGHENHGSRFIIILPENP